MSGIIISFLLGSRLSCSDQAKVQLIASIICIIVLYLLPESPEFLIKRNKIEVNIIEMLLHLNASINLFGNSFQF